MLAPHIPNALCASCSDYLLMDCYAINDQILLDLMGHILPQQTQEISLAISKGVD